MVDGDSTRPSKNGLGILVASRLPVAEGETLAVGVSTRMLEVTDVWQRKNSLDAKQIKQCVPLRSLAA